MKDSTKWLYFWMGYILSTLEFGLVFSFGALFSDIRDKFGTDRTTTVTVQSVLMGVSTCFSAVSGILINRLGLHYPVLISSICVSSGFILSFFATKIWHLLFTLSILAGVGISLIYVSTITIVATIQNRKQKALGIAIHSACVPIAGLIYPHLFGFLTTTYGLSGTFLILGGVFCNSFAFSLLVWFRRSDFFRHNAASNEGVKEENTEIIAEHSKRQKFCVNISVKKLMSLRFVCLIMASSFAIATSNGYLDFVFDISDWKGYSESETRNTFVIYNIFTIFFTLSPGVLKQKLDIDTYYYPFGLALIGLSGSLIILYSDSYIVYVIGTACMGAIPGVMSSAFIICSQLIHVEQISVALGLFDTVFGFLSASVGPLYGTIRDTTGTYNGVFLTTSIAQGISALLFIGDIIQRKILK